MTTKKLQFTSNKLICENCAFSCSKKQDLDRHNLTLKHVNTTITTEKLQITSNKFICEKCHFSCIKKQDFDRHNLTLKHINTAINNNIQQYNCECGKKYNHRASLYNHIKKCKNTIKNVNVVNYTLENEKDKVINHLIKEHSDFKNIVLEIVKSNSDLQKQLIDVCKNNNTTNINSNNINSNNKTFNLQFFLNEQCKDAMNISEFVNSFDLQLVDLESVGNLGYVEGITKQFLDKLNGMDIYKRPMHCSDAKRETIYIKDENKWEKEERGTPKLRKAIKTVSFNNLKLLVTWSDTYPESKNIESRLNDKYVKLVKQTTGGNGELTENEDKIIRRIAKEIIIEKS